VEEARELTETDPAISAGIFVMELHPWCGNAALLEVNDIGLRIARKTDLQNSAFAAHPHLLVSQ